MAGGAGVKLLAIALAVLLAVVVAPQASSHVCLNSSACGDCSSGDYHYHAPSNPAKPYCISIPAIGSVGDQTIGDAYSMSAAWVVGLWGTA